MRESISAMVARLDSNIISVHRLDTALFEELDALQVELGILSGERRFSPFLRPQFVSRTFYDEMRRAAEVLAGAFQQMTLAAVENDEILNELGLTETEARYARMDPGYPEVCNSSRLDSFISGGDFNFLEYNAETPAGITDQMQIEKLLKRIPEVGKFLDQNDHWMPRPQVALLNALVGGYRDFGGKKEKPNIAIVDWKGVLTFTEFEVLKEFFVSAGHPTRIVDPRELEYDGETLRVGEFEVDIFYKRVVIHELFEKADDNHPLLTAYRDGNVFMANSFRSKIPHKKASLAVLSNDRYEHLFTATQLEMIERHLPWTRLVSDREVRFEGGRHGLLELARRERHRFILKPNDDYGGAGIVFGWESTESEWDDALEAALNAPFVVQERVPVEKVMFPTYDGEATMEELLIDFDPFLFRGQAEGGLVRLSSSSLVNVSAGGGEAALVVLNEY